MGVPRKIATSLNVRSRKRIGKVCRRAKNSNEELLPKDVLVSVFALVASYSLEDLFNAKLRSSVLWFCLVYTRMVYTPDFSCTDFLEATNDEYIYEFVSIHKFPICNWVQQSDKVVSFLTRCFEKGNAEALFRHGMREYFTQGNVESGLGFLKRASEKKHLEATYVYGMYLLTRGDESSKQGLELLNGLKSSAPGSWNVQDCRNRVKFILDQIWLNHKLRVQKVHTKCRDQDHEYQFRKRPCDFDTNQKIFGCDTCMWYRELVFFCRTMSIDVIITK